jgi:hypothetical protein
MLTITIDDELVSQAREVGKHKNDMEVSSLLCRNMSLTVKNWRVQICLSKIG